MEISLEQGAWFIALVQCYSFSAGIRKCCQDSIRLTHSTKFSYFLSKSLKMKSKHSSAPKAAKDTEKFTGFYAWNQWFTNIFILEALSSSSYAVNPSFFLTFSLACGHRALTRRAICKRPSNFWLQVIQYLYSWTKRNGMKKDWAIILKDDTFHEDLLLLEDIFPLKIYTVSGDSSGFATVLPKREEIYNDSHRSWGMSLVLDFITNTRNFANFSITGKSARDYNWGWKSTWLMRNLNWLVASKSQKSFLSRERLCEDDTRASSKQRTNPDTSIFSQERSGNVANPNSIYIFPKWVYMSSQESNEIMP